MADEVRVAVSSDADIVTARQQGRALAAQLGFDLSEQTLIATAISEVARNIITYARCGEIFLSIVREGGKSGIAIIARDEGPGIADIALAMEDGYSTSHGLGLGLPGSKRLMDDFDIVSQVGVGTTVTMRKWKGRS